MANIICLETATTNCSVAIGVNGQVQSLVEENTPNYSHAEQLHVFIEAALKKAALPLEALDAVAVSKGPGSYTGLRIGVSAAKGLCFSLDLPLIAIPTLQSMAMQVKLESNEVVIPLLDARRMEVYSEVYDASGTSIRETKAEVITESSFTDYTSCKRVHLIGPGASKCEEVLTNPVFSYITSAIPSAQELASLAERKFKQQEFEDVAYFEPYYLKDFVLQGKKKP